MDMSFYTCPLKHSLMDMFFRACSLEHVVTVTVPAARRGSRIHATDARANAPGRASACTCHLR